MCQNYTTLYYILNPNPIINMYKNMQHIHQETFNLYLLLINQFYMTIKQRITNISPFSTHQAVYGAVQPQHE